MNTRKNLGGTIRTYVTDTNVLLKYHDILHELSGCSIVIPMAFIVEMDRFKGLADAQDPRAKVATERLRRHETVNPEQKWREAVSSDSGSGDHCPCSSGNREVKQNMENVVPVAILSVVIYFFAGFYVGALTAPGSVTNLKPYLLKWLLQNSYVIAITLTHRSREESCFRECDWLLTKTHILAR